MVDLEQGAEQHVLTCPLSCFEQEVGLDDL